MLNVADPAHTGAFRTLMENMAKAYDDAYISKQPYLAYDIANGALALHHLYGPFGHDVCALGLERWEELQAQASDDVVPY